MPYFKKERNTIQQLTLDFGELSKLVSDELSPLHDMCANTFVIKDDIGCSNFSGDLTWVW